MLYLLGKKLGLLLFNQSYVDEEDIDAVRY